MIINFSIQNFGSINEKQTLSFEATKQTDLEDYYIIKSINGLRLLKIGLIYGANASGKTTVLKALDLFRDIVLEPAEKKTEEFNFNPFLFDTNTPYQNSIFSIEFIQNDIRYFYEVELNKKHIQREVLYFYNPNKASVFKRNTDIERQYTEITFGSKIKKDKASLKAIEVNTLWNNTVLGGFLKTNIEINELKEVTDWFLNYLKPVIKTKHKLKSYITNIIDSESIKKNTIVQILNKADFSISDILIDKKEKDLPQGFIEFLEKQEDIPEKEKENIKSKGKITDTIVDFEHTIDKSKFKLSFDLESEGTKRYYGFAGLLCLLIEKSAIYPIDELESSLHPDLFKHFILTFLINSKKSQILATTHNREILNNKDIFRNDAIWFTDKNEAGATQLYSLADFDSKVIRDTSSVFNAYLTGKLGGVPNLGDYFLDINHEQ